MAHNLTKSICLFSIFKQLTNRKKFSGYQYRKQNLLKYKKYINVINIFRNIQDGMFITEYDTDTVHYTFTHIMQLQ